ncbi:hypothetical protein F5Y18DRAFT_428266 [Xylariaceae sp. FL1019]|nr:hypothetical protein F5Y18DRAFT_428266 [Xylariaceae sp. FL1019]
MHLRRVLEQSWSISDDLKNEKPNSLFWVGRCIADIVRKGSEIVRLDRHSELLMGVTFPFPIEQDDLERASTMSRGIGFAVTSTKSLIKPSKLPRKIQTATDVLVSDIQTTVNTEWSINGTAQILRKTGLISAWDLKLDAAGVVPGFQPFEYMISGLYLGELARLILAYYLISHLTIPEDSFKSLEA